MTPVLDQVEPIALKDLKKSIRVPRFEFETWMEIWDWTFHQLARNEFPEPFTSLDEFQLACICADPALWVQCFLREPEDPDHQDPYSLWDNQKESIRYFGHKLHKDGAEVGKTREIVAFVLSRAFTVKNGSGLIGAPMQVYLQEIMEAMDDQLTWNPDLANSRRHRRHKDGWLKAPHHAWYFTNGFKIDFRPSGHDGRAYRGVHARTFALKDEAAKDKASKTWSEFWRSVKPGCMTGLYSVPDGDRSCDFFKFGQKAIKVSVEHLARDELQKNLLESLFTRYKKQLLDWKVFVPLASAGDIYGINNIKKSKDAAVDDDGDVPGHLKNMKFKLFRWPKTEMPFPYWSKERKEECIERFGEEDSPAYIHNVLGEDGDPEYSVFPWEQLKHCIKDIPEYRCLKIIVNSTRGEVSVKCYKIEVRPGDSEPVYQKVTLLDTTYGKAGFFDYSINPDGTMTESEFRKIIKSQFQSVPGLTRTGADFGFAGDPTEILAKSIIGKKKRLVARLQLKHVTYDQQCQAQDAIDDIYGPPESISHGTDFGNAGSAVAHDLQGLPQYAHKNYEHRLKGFQFESTTDNVDREGNKIIDAKDGKPARITLKEVATDLMTKLMQELNAEYPGDPDIIHFYPNHTVSNKGKHRIYKKEDDHIIDADRAETLAEVLGGVVYEHFSSGVNIR